MLFSCDNVYSLLVESLEKAGSLERAKKMLRRM